jgi:hypothetical protein
MDDASSPNAKDSIAMADTKAPIPAPEPAKSTPVPAPAPEAATYAKLFPEQLADRCAPDALESNSGPIAYLHALYQQALALESTSTSDNRFTLADRRPDISELLLDEAALQSKVAPLTLAINALTHCARSHVGASSNLIKVISQANYQTGLPYHYPLEQIQAVLKHKKIPLFELLQTSKNTFPNFCYGQLRTDELRQVMRTSTGFSPALQTLLLDSSATTAESFLSERFGVTAKGADALTQLRNVDFFCSKTGLKPQQVQDLLAISGVDDDAAQGISSVKNSSAFRAEGDAVAGGHLYGAAFINNGSTPALSLEDKRVGVGITLEIKGGTAAHFGRIHKVIHLQHVLKLPFEDVDLLLMSAMRAEGQTKNFKITENTLRALGVFRFLSEIHGLTAPQFAALIHEVSPYAAAGRVSFLDRVLGASAVEKRASVGGELIIDGREFDPAEQPDSQGSSTSALVIGQLTRALSLDERLTRSYLALATQALGLKKPTLTLALVSSLYRLSQLPRLLRISAEEGASLIGILTISNKDFLGIIAGKGFISDANDKPDILDVLVAVANTQRWLRRNHLSARAVLSVLTPPAQGAQQPSADVLRITKVLAAYASQVRTACYTQANMSSLDIGKLKLKSSKWHELLKAYVDDSGLVKADLPEEKPLIKALESALKGKLEKGDEFINVAATQMASLLTNALVAQEDLAENIVVEVLAQVVGASAVSSEHVLPLLDWVDTTPLDVLANVLQAAAADQGPAADNAQSSKTFTLWAKLARHARAVQLMGLSADGLDALVYNTARFDLEEVADKGDTTVATLNLDLLYQLSCYRDWITMCQANAFKESDALNWLLNQAIVEKPDEIKAAAKRLGELIGWEKETARFTAGTAQPAKKTSAKPSLLPPFARHISGIDLILRLKSLCDSTGLSCESLLYLSLLGEQSTYEQINIAGQTLLGACDEEARDVIEGHLQETWRDALAAYLMAYWVAAETTRETFMPTREDLSNYFLTDIWVTREARKTTTVTQAISTLQHYLHRLLSHLEPGYEAAELPQQVVDNWHRYLSQYGTWKTLRAQLNHPENLIYYANRPNKSAAFKDLEVEVNQISQGKLDTQRLQTAVLNYLTKFERLSNLQVISGYLDGRDPKNDTYYLIGKTNASPTEYYLRSLDMGLRDDRQRLNPLAWSEWEKIALSPSGQVAQSAYKEAIKVTQPKLNADKKEEKDDKGNIVTEEVEQTITRFSDAVRPVIISGRPYVFWVERGTTDLPSKDGNGKTLAGKRRLSVQYVYRQSDGFWSTANELMCLDGTKNGERLPDKDNPYLMDESYAPGLIAFVNVEDRQDDPWLTVILYDSRSKELGIRDKDYFVEMRDLLLLERKSLDSALLADLGKTSYNSHRNLNHIQHIYSGAQRWVGRTYASSHLDDPMQDEEGNVMTVTAEFLNHSTIKITVKCLIFDELTKKSYEDEDEDEDDTEVIPGTIKPESYEALKPLEASKKFKSNDEDAKVITKLNTHEIDAYGKFSRLYPCELKEIAVEYNYNKTDESPLVFTISTYQKSKIYLHRRYQIEIAQSRTDEKWNISITNKDQAQYLDLSSVSDQLPKLASDKVRLNTLFGKQLVGRATESVERALGWDTQKLREPTIDDSYPNPTVDFHGANGLYFRELFLHLPALIANRLTEQQQFEDAENWYLGYLFDPYRAQPDEDGSPAYWNTRPLAEVGTLSSELLKPIDPVTRAFTLSRYYRQAVFLGLVENWQQQGDHYFRQLTLSSLNHAWLCYQQAMKLIGPLPERAEVTRWNPVALASVAAGHFRISVNQRVIDLRDTLENRLYNLRHGLTINGKPLPDLRWSDEGEDPFASAKGGVNLIAGSYNSERASIPAYRFRQLLPAARAAARQLADLGRHYMKLMEDESDATLSTLLTAQEIKMCDFTTQLQQEAILSVQASQRTLELGRSAALARKAHFQALLDEGKSPMEEAATGLAITSKVSNAAAVPFEALEAIQKQIPTIFGMAFGGNHPDAFAAKIASTFRIIGDIAEFSSEQLVQEAGYERRASDWEFERQQAEWDIKFIDQQIAETEIELKAAKISLAEARQHRANLEEAYTVMTTGFVIVPIYNWLVSRQEQIYGAAYDAVLSLCLSLEAAWRYEIGDYTHQAFINTSAWRDAYKGMLAGESLLVDLQAMENAYVQANERRLTIKRSFSIKGARSDKDWKQALEDLKKNKPLTFEFKAADFDRDYPGQYLRQLKHVSVSFVLGSGQSLEGLSAILTQTGNTTLVEADEAGAAYLYTPTDVPPASIKRNLRAQQQIALSSSVSEDGLGFGPGEWVQELMFHDGRYLPFEGTGAISQWELQMPGKSATSLFGDKVILSDIQINLVYTAVPGGSALVTKISELLT